LNFNKLYVQAFLPSLAVAVRSQKSLHVRTKCQNVVHARGKGKTMIQQISQQPQGTIPPDATTLAATHHLGTPVARYKNRFIGVIFGAFLWACIGILLTLTILSGFNLTSIIFALAGISLICYAIIRFAKALTNRGTNIYFCTEGLMRTTGETVEAMRWDQAREVVKRYRQSLISLLSFRYSTSPQYTLDAYVVRSSDGKEIVIDSVFSKVKQLGKTLEQAITTMLMPSILASYQSGHPVQFGEITVSSGGLTLHSGQLVIPWDGINYVKSGSGGGSIFIHWKPQDQLLYKTERLNTENIPNAFIFLTLAQQIHASQKPSKR
jgi:hypothetical protein